MKAYYDPLHPGSFGGVNRLYSSLKADEPTLSRDQVKQFLQNSNTYTLHKDRRYKFKRNRVIALYPDYQWCADLADMSSYARVNNGYRYILTVIDVFTKYLWLVPIKTKQPANVIAALTTIIDSGRRPHRLRTDRGREFVSKEMSEWLKKMNIQHLLTTNTTYKAATAERVQRTIKQRMFRFFTRTGSHRYIDRLPDFVRSYNNSYHRTIKMTPNAAVKADHTTVFRNSYGVDSVSEMEEGRTPKLKEGDTVRLAYDRGVFDKGFWRTHTDNTATVEQALHRQEPMYVLKDYTGTLPRRYYEAEIQKIAEPSHRVEKVIKTRERNGRRQYYVTFIGYPASENQWVDNLEEV